MVPWWCTGSPASGSRRSSPRSPQPRDRRAGALHAGHRVGVAAGLRGAAAAAAAGARPRRRLPAPQAAALRAAFGQRRRRRWGPVPGLPRRRSSLLSAAADGDARCSALVDDAHWLDDASAAALLFVARRLERERVALVFAAASGRRTPLRRPGLPVLDVAGLDDAAARALLAAGRCRRRAGGGRAARPADRRQPAGAARAARRSDAARSSPARTPLPPHLPLTEELEAAFARPRTGRLAPGRPHPGAGGRGRRLDQAASGPGGGRRLGAETGSAVLDEAERSGLPHRRGRPARVPPPPGAVGGLPGRDQRDPQRGPPRAGRRPDRAGRRRAPGLAPGRGDRRAGRRGRRGAGRCGRAGAAPGRLRGRERGVRAGRRAHGRGRRAGPATAGGGVDRLAGGRAGRAARSLADAAPAPATTRCCPPTSTGCAARSSGTSARSRSATGCCSRRRATSPGPTRPGRGRWPSSAAGRLTFGGRLRHRPRPGRDPGRPRGRGHGPARAWPPCCSASHELSARGRLAAAATPFRRLRRATRTSSDDRPLHEPRHRGPAPRRRRGRLALHVRLAARPRPRGRGRTVMVLFALSRRRSLAVCHRPVVDRRLPRGRGARQLAADTGQPGPGGDCRWPGWRCTPRCAATTGSTQHAGRARGACCAGHRGRRTCVVGRDVVGLGRRRARGRPARRPCTTSSRW